MGKIINMTVMFAIICGAALVDFAHATGGTCLRAPIGKGIERQQKLLSQQERYSYFIEFGKTHLMDYKKYPEEFVFLWSVFQVWAREYKAARNNPAVSWLIDLESPECALDAAGDILKTVCVKNGGEKIRFEYKHPRGKKYIRVYFHSGSVDMDCVLRCDTGSLELGNVLGVKNNEFFAWMPDNKDFMFFSEYVYDAEDAEYMEHVQSARPEASRVKKDTSGKINMEAARVKKDASGKKHIKDRPLPAEKAVVDRNNDEHVDAPQEFVDSLDARERALFHEAWLWFVRKERAGTDLRLVFVKQKFKDLVLAPQNIEVSRALLRKCEEFIAEKVTLDGKQMLKLSAMFDFLNIVIVDSGLGLDGVRGAVDFAEQNEKVVREESFSVIKLEDKEIRRVVIADARRRLAVRDGAVMGAQGDGLAKRVIRILDSDKSSGNNQDAAGLLRRINPANKISDERLLDSLVELIRHRNEPIMGRYRYFFDYYKGLSASDYDSPHNAPAIRWICDIVISFLNGQIHLDDIPESILKTIANLSSRNHV
ncbi:MAG: hypothetical protein WC569_04880 [Candidatus Omnitrophota bacterium]